MYDYGFERLFHDPDFFYMWLSILFGCFALYKVILSGINKPWVIWAQKGVLLIGIAAILGMCFYLGHRYNVACWPYYHVQEAEIKERQEAPSKRESMRRLKMKNLREGKSNTL